MYCQETLKWKTELAFGNGLAGIMVWEVNSSLVIMRRRVLLVNILLLNVIIFQFT